MCSRRWLILALAAMFMLAVGTMAVQAQPSGMSVWPNDGQREISPGGYVRLSFPESMDTASVQAAFTITPTVVGTYAWDAMASPHRRPTRRTT